MDLQREIAVEVCGLSVVYPDGTEALRDISMTVKRGEFLGLAGPDGAGKSTLLSVLAGLTPPRRGLVKVLQEELPKGLSRLKRRVGYLPQRFSHYLDLTVDENIAFFARVYRVEDWRKKREALLRFTGLTPFRDRLAEHLSGGMKQKLALACTLIHEPEVLLLDEPTAGVDPASRREFLEILSHLVSRGMTILMATPYLDEAERCHRVALLHKGSLLALGDLAYLRTLVRADTYEVLCPNAREALKVISGLPQVVDAHCIGSRIHFVPSSEDAISSILSALASAGFEPKDIRPIRPTLEDIFIALTKRER